MLAYILGITKRGNKGITKRDKISGLQIGAWGITNRGNNEFKSRQRDIKSGQRLQIGAREILIRGRDYKSVRNRYHYQW